MPGFIWKKHWCYTSRLIGQWDSRLLTQGTLLAKSAIKSAFCLLPVHPDCFHLLGCMLDRLYFHNMCLPMGCSISSQFFEMSSSFLEWIDWYQMAVIHYLNDFLLVGHKDSDCCRFLLDTFHYFIGCFGVSFWRETTEDPTTSLLFSGIELDMIDLVFCIFVPFNWADWWSSRWPSYNTFWGS